MPFVGSLEVKKVIHAMSNNSCGNVND